MKSTRNLITGEAAAGVGHHVALSVVGSEGLTESGYFRAKIAQDHSRWRGRTWGPESRFERICPVGPGSAATMAQCMLTRGAAQ
jgi:hypothetical protein